MALETFPSDPLSPLHWNLTLLGVSTLVMMMLLVVMCSHCGKRKSDQTSDPERSEGTELASLPQTTAENEIWKQNTNASTAAQPKQQATDREKVEKRNADVKPKGKAKKKERESDRPQKEDSPDMGGITDVDKDERGKVHNARKLPELPGTAREVIRRHSSYNSSSNVYDVVSEVMNEWPLDSRTLCKQTSDGSNLYDEIRRTEDSKTVSVYTKNNKPKTSGPSPQPRAQVGAAVPTPETQEMPLYAKVNKPRTRAVQAEII
ncbi:hypothetical protein AOXY_G25965 [Acipenser oxyrinchus oxyrinchus]|uniref:Uncharacterized protein n=1 Tax=Acipenser oxyrinchus oxyrinchus TaxID=40147 RepID=A0AAD8FXJ5_ACIOX|nr:hypothetical protein AOXY_G25965 [Acipenser oxyrinchus oxyrinchus]